MNELIFDLFNLIIMQLNCITDIRNLSRVCSFYKELLKSTIIERETEYVQKYSKFNFSEHLKFYSIEKFTIEIILDEYYNLLPTHYFNKDNQIISSILAFKGNIEMFKFAKSRKCLMTKYSLSCAGYSGNIELIKFISLYFEINANIARNASYGGHVIVIDWIRRLYPKLIEVGECIRAAIEFDKVNVLEYFVKNYEINNYTKLNFHYAVECGKINVLEWLYENKYLNNSFSVYFKKSNNIKVLEWAKNHNQIEGNNLCAYAANEGNLDALKWAHNNGYPFNESFCKNAVFRGHSNILQWMKENNYEIYEDFCRDAILLGRRSIIEWAKKNNYKIDKSYLVDVQFSRNESNWLEQYIDE
jgi:hypothetical protein